MQTLNTRIFAVNEIMPEIIQMVIRCNVLCLYKVQHYSKLRKPVSITINRLFGAFTYIYIYVHICNRPIHNIYHIYFLFQAFTVSYQHVYTSLLLLNNVNCD